MQKHHKTRRPKQEEENKNCFFPFAFCLEQTSWVSEKGRTQHPNKIQAKFQTQQHTGSSRRSLIKSRAFDHFWQAIPVVTSHACNQDTGDTVPSNTASAFQDSCSSAAAPFVRFQLHGLSSTNCSERGARKGPVGVVLKVPCDLLT